MTPVIFGLEGPTLTPAETSFLKDADPAGIILFGRNIENPDQVRGLTDSVRDLLGRDLLVLVDQEGGRIGQINVAVIVTINEAKQSIQVGGDGPG